LRQPTIYSYRAYAVSRVWDAANLLLTEYWTENPSTSTCSTGSIAGWRGLDGAKWHREWPGWTGWYPDTCNHYLGLVAGGIGYPYEDVGCVRVSTRARIRGERNQRPIQARFALVKRRPTC
jgi:hypothetical protein